MTAGGKCPLGNDDHSIVTFLSQIRHPAVLLALYILRMHSENTPLATCEPASLSETLNYLVTNRIPRVSATRLVGRLSQIRNKHFASAAIKVWQLFSDDMKLEEAEQTEFESIHDCFTRTLKDDARPVDQRRKFITSPCDAVIGAHGKIDDLKVLQVKGCPYSLEDLTQNTFDLEPYCNGRYITLRIKSSMYHHMHAPANCHIKNIHYISGDTWNVNPATLKHVENLFCRNERACMELSLDDFDGHIAMIPVAAILVASMRFEGLGYPLNLKYRGPNSIQYGEHFDKGQRIGNFEHGSTIILLASKDFEFCNTIEEGKIIRMGEALLTNKYSANALQKK